VRAARGRRAGAVLGRRKAATTGAGEVAKPPQTGATQDWRRHLTDCTISDDDAEVGIECLMVRRETGEVLRVRVSCWEGSSEPAQPPSHASAPARAQTKR